MNATTSKPRKGASAASAPKRQRAKRMPAEARKSVILREASQFFASHGLQASTRDLADRIGVRQALLYKYFSSKEALIEAVFARLIEKRRECPRATLRDDASTPLIERLLEFYDVLGQSNESANMRLAIRAVLEDLPLAGKVCEAMTHGLTRPLIAELRREEGLPDIASRPLMNGEIEAVLSFNAGALFMALRRHLRHLPARGTADEAARLCIASFLAGFRKTLRELHAGEWPATMRDTPPG